LQGIVRATVKSNTGLITSWFVALRSELVNGTQYNCIAALNSTQYTAASLPVSLHRARYCVFAILYCSGVLTVSLTRSDNTRCLASRQRSSCILWYLSHVNNCIVGLIGSGLLSVRTLSNNSHSENVGGRPLFGRNCIQLPQSIIATPFFVRCCCKHVTGVGSSCALHLLECSVELSPCRLVGWLLVQYLRCLTRCCVVPMHALV
jgi:hypothetical protein